MHVLTCKLREILKDTYFVGNHQRSALLQTETSFSRRIPLITVFTIIKNLEEARKAS